MKRGKRDACVESRAESGSIYRWQVPVLQGEAGQLPIHWALGPAEGLELCVGGGMERGRGSDVFAASQSHLSAVSWLAHIGRAASRLRLGLGLGLLGEVDLPVQTADPVLVGGERREDCRPRGALAGIAKAV